MACEDVVDSDHAVSVHWAMDVSLSGGVDLLAHLPVPVMRVHEIEMRVDGGTSRQQVPDTQEKV